MTPSPETCKRLKAICNEIGCSGLTPSMCNDRPDQCGIIRKLIFAAPDRIGERMEMAGKWMEEKGNGKN